MDLAAKGSYTSVLGGNSAVKGLAEKINNNRWNEITPEELNALWSAEGGVEWERKFVVLITLLHVPLDWKEPQKRTSLLEERIKIQKALNPQESLPEEALLGEIETKGATKIERPVDPALIHMAHDLDSFNKMMQNPKEHIVPSETEAERAVLKPEEKVLLELGERIGRIFGLEQVLGMCLLEVVLPCILIKPEN